MSAYGPDTRRLLAAQGMRAFAYGFGAVLLGTSLEERDVPAWQVGLVLGATVAGTALMSVLVARYADRVGRRRWYAGLYVLLGLVGVVFAVAGSVWMLVAAALTGVLSTEVIESGPFTSLEQPMLASDLRGRAQVHGFGIYNAIAAVAGSFGALMAARARPDQRGSAPAVVPGAGTGRGGRVGDRAVVERGGRARGRATRGEADWSGPGRRCRGWRRCSPSTPSAAGSRCRRSSPTG